MQNEKGRIFEARLREHAGSLDQLERTKRGLVIRLKNLYAEADRLSVLGDDVPDSAMRRKKVASEIASTEFSLHEALHDTISAGYQGDD